MSRRTLLFDALLALVRDPDYRAPTDGNARSYSASEAHGARCDAPDCDCVARLAPAKERYTPPG